MNSRVRSALTLLTLCGITALLGIGGAVGLLAPLPERDAPEPPDEDVFCEPATFAAGDQLKPEHISVTVLNAGQTSGLASKTAAEFISVGFGPGETSNAPEGTRVRNIKIWAADPEDPAVALVASYIGGAKMIEASTAELPDGVVVVVGDSFRKLKPGLKSIKLNEPLEVCQPVEPIE